jgi:4-amino-4-deoxy-L-arabinose transferase-like glycosyltransferase
MQRIIGIILGGLTIYLLLNIMDAVTKDTQPKYLLAILIGMIVALVWPWFIAFILARRVRQRRKEDIDREVAEQLAKK